MTSQMTSAAMTLSQLDNSTMETTGVAGATMNPDTLLCLQLLNLTYSLILEKLRNASVTIPPPGIWWPEIQVICYPTTTHQSSTTPITTTTPVIMSNQQVIGIAVGVSVGVAMVIIAVVIVIFIINKRSTLPSIDDIEKQEMKIAAENKQKNKTKNRRGKNAPGSGKAGDGGNAEKTRKIIYHTHTMPTIRDVIARTKPMMLEVLWEEDETESDASSVRSENILHKTAST